MVNHAIGEQERDINLFFDEGGVAPNQDARLPDGQGAIAPAQGGVRDDEGHMV